MPDHLVHRRQENALVTRAPTQEVDWSVLDEWLRGKLDLERDVIADEVGDALKQLLTEERVTTDGELGKLRREVSELRGKLDRAELKIAECSGAVRVLRTGRVLHVRGTFFPGAPHEQFDVVECSGSSFVALKDDPGPCPGGGWQLLASAGRCGARGLTGSKGERGEPGESAAAGPSFKAFHLDQQSYTLSLIMTDGKVHSVSLKGSFQQFLADVRGSS